MARDTILKRKLNEAGISQREIASIVKRTKEHVNYVVNGVRESRRLSFEILEICDRRITAGAPRRTSRRAM